MNTLPLQHRLFLLFLMLCLAGLLQAEGIIPVGSGSYTTSRPPGSKSPPEPVYTTSRTRRPIPSNDWWSSLAWMSNSFAQYPHPLAVKSTDSGLQIAYPGPGIHTDPKGIYGNLPAAPQDLILGHSTQRSFGKARVDGYSDWFVDLLFSENQHSMRVSYGHGSPFIYAVYQGGNPQVTLGTTPRIWSGGTRGPTLGLTLNGRHYGLFGPAGSRWLGLGSRELTCDTGGKSYFSLAVLPDDQESTLQTFQRFAHHHVIQTRVDWRFDEGTSEVTTRFRFETRNYEGNGTGTIFALYPHQWRHCTTRWMEQGYDSVRGRMKLFQGTQFETRMKFHGVLPALPNVGGLNTNQMRELLRIELEKPDPESSDTYWDGKRMGKLATLIPIAEEYGLSEQAQVLRTRVQRRLESWFTARTENGSAKTRQLFQYNKAAGTLIGYPASYGSDVELNDHHFHYGYFIKAAAEIARQNPEWGSGKKWGGMVRELILDAACPDPQHPRYPFLRCFDPFAGHSWASGTSHFPDGNNNESSSEAMNAWSGILLWGSAIGDRALRDLGIYLYTTEKCAIQDYWFDVHDENHPPDYNPSVVTMIWGAKGVNETWFSSDPQLLHGINWLPIHGGSLYLGHFPDYAEKNYRALVREHSNRDHFNNWPDLAWMYRALSDPADAVKLYEASAGTAKFEDGNTRANTAHWIYSLSQLGRPDPSITANHPLHAVFQRGNIRTYVLWNLHGEPLQATFSDGQRIESRRRGAALIQKQMP